MLVWVSEIGGQDDVVVELVVDVVVQVDWQVQMLCDDEVVELFEVVIGLLCWDELVVMQEDFVLVVVVQDELFEQVVFGEVVVLDYVLYVEQQLQFRGVFDLLVEYYDGEVLGVVLYDVLVVVVYEEGIVVLVSDVGWVLCVGQECFELVIVYFDLGDVQIVWMLLQEVVEGGDLYCQVQVCELLVCLL